MNDAAGSDVTVTEPGAVTCDVDGIPTAVGESTETVASLARLTITKAEADRLGVTPEEFPNVNIVD